jgi:hypothetical protein
MTVGVVLGQNESGSHGQRNPAPAVFLCLIPFASHALFMRAFSTASGFLSITVKQARK